jgi:Sulfotransferase domain
MTPSSPAQRALICSYPKSGRTWLRYMLAHVLVTHFALDVKLDLANMFSVVPNDDLDVERGWPGYRFLGVLPSVATSHKRYKERLHGGCRIIFLVRDPRDVVVSYWFHRSRHMGLLAGELSEFVRDPRYGITDMLDYLETWAVAAERERLLIVSYEEMKADAFFSLRRICDFLEVPVSDNTIRAAAAAGEFSRMREMELETAVGGYVYDRSDDSALRVRRGRAHGFVDYLSRADEKAISSHLASASHWVQKILDRPGYPGIDGR